MELLSTVFIKLFFHISFLLSAIFFFIFIYLLSFNNFITQTIFKIYSKEKLHKVRENIIIFILLFVTTLLYLILDTHIINLPDPIILYAFYILGITILFGISAAIPASILSVMLIEYYLYEPRFILVFHHPANVIYIIVVNLIGLLLGHTIRQYQQNLLKKK